MMRPPGYRRMTAHEDQRRAGFAIEPAHLLTPLARLRASRLSPTG
jgi:hypothetical protein